MELESFTKVTSMQYQISHGLLNIEKSCTHLGPSWSTFHAEVHIFRSYGRTENLVFGKNIRRRPSHFGRFPPFSGTEILLIKVDITLNLESANICHTASFERICFALYLKEVLISNKLF